MDATEEAAHLELHLPEPISTKRNLLVIAENSVSTIIVTERITGLKNFELDEVQSTRASRLNLREEAAQKRDQLLMRVLGNRDLLSSRYAERKVNGTTIDQ